MKDPKKMRLFFFLVGGKHLKNWRFRCLPRCFRSKSHVVFLTCGHRWLWFGRVFQRESCFVFSSPKSDFLIHKATTSPPYSNPFLRQNLVEGWVFIPFLARTSSPKGLIPKNPPGKLSSQFGIHPEAKAELDKLEEKEKAEAEITTSGTWDWTFWCSPKLPGFKKGGVFLSRWKESRGFWRSAESRNELIHMLRSFKNHYVFIYTHLNVGSKVLWTFLSAFFGVEFRLWGGLFPNIPSSTYKRWPAIAFQVQQQIGQFIPNWDEMKLQF